MKPATLLAALALGAAFCSAGLADVVRPAPQFSFTTASGQTQTLEGLKGQPVILLLADSAKRGDFRTQLRELESAMDRLAIRKTLIVAALKKDDAAEIRSNIPVTVLPDGAQVCDAYGLKTKFAIALIGPDGNLDYQTERILNINRVLEVMQNTYEVQKASRR